MNFDNWLTTPHEDSSRETDCEGFQRIRPCLCGETRLENDPPVCLECGEATFDYMQCQEEILPGNTCGVCEYTAQPSKGKDD